MIQATLHQLKVFEATARHGSFTRAAEELYITQPTVSSQIKQLTKAIGLPLFEQIGKRLHLTEAGRSLLATCQEIFRGLDNFEMKVADLKGMKQGQLRLGVITTAKYFIPRILGAFCRQFPDIDVSLNVVNHQQIQERMMNNEDDLYILSHPPENLDVQAEAFLDNPLVIVAPCNHRLREETHIPIAELQDEAFIMREQGSGTRRAVESLLAEHGVSVRVRLELGSNEAIKQAVAGGMGMSVLSRHTLVFERLDSDIILLDVDHFPIACRWYVLHLNGKNLSVIAQTFKDYLIVESQRLAATYHDTLMSIPR